MASCSMLVFEVKELAVTRTDPRQNHHVPNLLVSHLGQGSLDYVHWTKEICFELVSNERKSSLRDRQLLYCSDNRYERY